MVSNTTRNIDGVDYTFGDDGSWVAPRTTAPKGHITGGRYYNTWSNLCIPQIIGTTETKKMSVTTISAANIMRSETRTAHRISA